MSSSSKPFDWSRPADLAGLAILLLLGSVGGGLAFASKLPMPFLIGSLVTTITCILWANRKGHSIGFPKTLRLSFVGLIGTMIGATFTPALLSAMTSLWLTLGGLVIYVVVAHSLGYALCRAVGGYDKTTAIYASMPGGMIEAVELGTKAGGDPRVLMLSHFLRVLLVVLAVPWIFWIFADIGVARASGGGVTTADATLADVLTLAALTVAGLGLGRVLRLPAGHLLGPMLLSALAHASGLTDATSPVWLLFLAQLIVGVGLGTLFSGSSGPTFGHILSTTAIMVAAMLVVSAGFALGLAQVSSLDVNALFLSLAPGGIAEMGLVALSMGLSPVVVTSHHVFRIFLTVAFAAWVTRRSGQPGGPSGDDGVV